MELLVLFFFPLKQAEGKQAENVIRCSLRHLRPSHDCTIYIFYSLKLPFKVTSSHVFVYCTAAVMCGAIKIMHKGKIAL